MVKLPNFGKYIIDWSCKNQNIRKKKYRTSAVIFWELFMNLTNDSCQMSKKKTDLNKTNIEFKIFRCENGKVT